MYTCLINGHVAMISQIESRHSIFIQSIRNSNGDTISSTSGLVELEHLRSSGNASFKQYALGDDITEDPM